VPQYEPQQQLTPPISGIIGRTDRSSAANEPDGRKNGHDIHSPPQHLLCALKPGAQHFSPLPSQLQAYPPPTTVPQCTASKVHMFRHVTDVATVETQKSSGRLQPAPMRCHTAPSAYHSVCKNVRSSSLNITNGRKKREAPLQSKHSGQGLLQPKTSHGTTRCTVGCERHSSDSTAIQAGSDPENG
jgi:hypothetical protein